MMRDNLDYLYDNDKLQMSHNLKVVRIEDFLVNSRQLAFEMIDFAHFGPSGHLNDWLNTHLNEETEKAHAFKSCVSPCCAAASHFSWAAVMHSHSL